MTDIPIIAAFFIIALGTAIGEFSFFKIKLGKSAVLLCSLLAGIILSVLPESGNAVSEQNTYAFMSSLGTVIFISVTGIRAGAGLSGRNKLKYLKAFIIGCLSVMAGAAAAYIIKTIDRNLPPPLLSGLFAGAMTSTPALAVSSELFVSDPLLSSGYGMSYFVSVLTIVVSVQLICGNTTTVGKMYTSDTEKQKEKKPHTLFIMSITAIFGMLLGKIRIPLLSTELGNTGGILLAGTVFGCLCCKNRNISSLDILSDMGLYLFFVGNGIPAGEVFLEYISLKYILYGMLICCSALFVSYLLSGFLFGKKSQDRAAAVSGSMTSSPAIALAESKNKSTDLSVFAYAYTGALLMLTVSAKALYFICK